MQPRIAYSHQPRLASLLRAHGHPCRIVGNVIRAAYVLGGRWAVAPIFCTGDAEHDRENVRTWLGY